MTAAALRGIVNAKDLDIEWPAPEKVPPLWKMREQRRNVHRASVQYGPARLSCSMCGAERICPPNPRQC